VPRRGRENEPGLVTLVGAAVATAARQSEAEIAERTADNAAVAFSGTGSAP
jgi:Tat protein secretion system quality control protein TatD with DNase activity